MPHPFAFFANGWETTNLQRQPVEQHGLSRITWNAAGQPATVTALSGSPIAGTYDALGRLVETDAGGEAAQFFFSPTGAKVAVVKDGALTKATIPAGAPGR